LDKRSPHIYAFKREGEGQKLLIVLNFSSVISQVNVAVSPEARVLLSNYGDALANQGRLSINLRPYEAIIYKQ
jgi:oligo-1,6-glucosidase